MSDTKEIIYNSPSMGRVRLVRATWASTRLPNLQAVELYLSDCAARGRQRDGNCGLHTDDFDAIAAELEGRAKHVAPVMTTRNGLVDPSILTDDQLIDEWRRRFPASRLLVCHATDDQLRAECERRSIKGLSDRYGGLVRGTGAFDFIGERDKLKAEVERLTKERDALRAEALRRAGFDTHASPLFGFKAPSVGNTSGGGANRTLAAPTTVAAETGPGIVGVKVEKDTAHYVDPTDLLCEDV